MRKKICIIASLCIAFGVLWAGTGNGSEKVLAATTIGEIDGSEGITSGDLDALKAHLAGASTLADDALANAEVTGDTDGTGPDVADVVRLKRYLTTPDTSWYEDANKKTDANGDYYEISDLADLLGLAKITTVADKEIRLVNDIVVNPKCAIVYATNGRSASQKGLCIEWTPIQNFTGTFDGQDHTLTGFYQQINNSAPTYGCGVFATVNGATIKNVNIDHGCFWLLKATNLGVGFAAVGHGTFENIKVDVILRHETGTIGNVGSIVGKADGQTTITNCWSNSRIYANSYQAGGIMGAAGGNNVTISNCLYSGYMELAKASARAGGILGVGIKTGESAGTIAVNDCLVTGMVKRASSTDANVGAVIGWPKQSADTLGTVTVSNTGYVDYSDVDATGATTTAGSGFSSTATTSSLTKAYSTDPNASGYGSSAVFNTLNWSNWTVQAAGTPILTCFAPNGKVTAPTVDTTWYTKQNTDGLDTFRLVTGNQLLGLAELSATYDFAGETIQLDKNIVVAEGTVSEWEEEAPSIIWTPIQNFAGTFDGQGRTISGIYIDSTSYTDGVGVFNNTNGATIQNLKVTDSLITGAVPDSVSMGVGLIGVGNGTFTNIYSDIVITNTSTLENATRENLGGILGRANGTTIITSCWSNSTITTGVRGRIGGIVGYTDTAAVTISNCLNTGNLTSTVASRTAYIGGILGATPNLATDNYDSNGNVQITDCLNLGCVKSANASDGSIGGLLGAAGNSTSSNPAVPKVTLTNSYWVTYTTDSGKVAATTVGISSYMETPTGIGNGVIDDMIGEAGKDTCKNLSWYDETTNPEGYWIVQTESTPILKAFAVEE